MCTRTCERRCRAFVKGIESLLVAKAVALMESRKEDMKFLYKWVLRPKTAKPVISTVLPLSRRMTRTRTRTQAHTSS
jgi:hypothetical protein